MGEHLNQRDALGRLHLKVMVANRTREIRPSGMKRGACGNVSVTGVGLRPIGKLMELPPNPTMLRALHFYPNRMTDVAVELRRRQPIRVVRITFGFLTFDGEGYFDASAFDRHQRARAELGLASLIAEPEGAGTVVDAANRFVAQGGLWAPSRTLQLRIDATALGQLKCTQL